MSYALFAHPFSSYCWKALIALYEKELPFDYRMVEGDGVMEALRGYWPLGKFPVLVDEGGDAPLPVIESTTIIEYLDLRHYERAPLIPAQPADALDVRFMDRVFDNHVMTPMNAIVQEYLVDRAAPDRVRIGKAEQALDTIYGWLDARLASRWPIARRRQRCSMLTGCGRSRRALRRCGPIAPGSMPIPRSRVASRRRGPIAVISRPVRPSATDDPAPWRRMLP